MFIDYSLIMIDSRMQFGATKRGKHNGSKDENHHHHHNHHSHDNNIETTEKTYEGFWFMISGVILAVIIIGLILFFCKDDKIQGRERGRSVRSSKKSSKSKSRKSTKNIKSSTKKSRKSSTKSKR